MVNFAGLIKRFSNIQLVFRSAFILLILFLVFFAINLFISIKSNHETAYKSLTAQDKQIMLQDTRVHNWSEINKSSNDEVRMTN